MSVPTLRLDHQKLRTLRVTKAITQADLAHAAGITAATLCKIEAGRNVRLSTIRSLANALGVEPTDIATLEVA